MQNINPPSDGDTKMRKLTEKQYAGFARLNQQIQRAIESDGLKESEDLQKLKMKWKANEKIIGKTCDQIACDVAGHNYHEYFAALERQEQHRAKIKAAQSEKEHRQNLLDRIGDMQDALTHASGIIDSESTDGLCIHSLEKVSAQAECLVKVISDNARMRNSQTADPHTNGEFDDYVASLRA